VERVELPRQLCAALRAAARRQGVSLFMLMQAAFAALLARYSAQEQLNVGSAVANRRRRETEPIVGMLVDSVVLANDLSGNPAVGELLQATRRLCLEAGARQDVPFDQVVEAVQPERDLAYNPLFQHCFSFHDSPLGELAFPGLVAELTEAVSNGSAKFDINVICIPRRERRVGRPGAGEDGITVLWEYVTALFDAATARRMIGNFERLLEGFTAEPEVRVAELPLLTVIERRQLSAADRPGRGRFLAYVVPAAEEQPWMAPRTPAEERLAGIWSEVLGVKRVGVHDNFFLHLGGHSLLATRVASRVRRAFGVELPLPRLFERPTLGELAAWIEEARCNGGGDGVRPLAPAARDAAVPLSFAQERIWFLSRLNPESPAYNISRAFALRGPLDQSALAASVREMARRYETLRTTFSAGPSGPLQRIAPEPDVALPLVDLAGLPEGSRRREAEELRSREASRAFDLERGPLLRSTLLRLTATEHALLLTLHHIVADGWSVAVLCRELSRLYAGDALPEPAVQYADFAVWQREHLAGKRLERLLAYWRERLAGAPAVLELPSDRPRAPTRTFAGDRRSFALPVPVDALQELGAARGASVFMVLLAAFYAVLHRTTGVEDLVIGSPIAGRDHSELEGAIGLFINTLVLRVGLGAGDPSFAEVLRRTRDATLGAYDHQEIPFEKLVEALVPERDLSHTPLFQVLFALQNAGRAELALRGLVVEPLEVWSGTAKFDLSFTLVESGDGLALSLIYDRHLFDATTMARLAGHYTTLLDGAADDPQRRLSELPLLVPGERQQLLREWNDTRAELPGEHRLHRLIAAQAARTPDAVAVAYEAESLTYRELESRASRLARRLLRLGVGPEARVAIAAERSLELVVGLLGILKAGGAYVPLDPSYPRERLALMLADLARGGEPPVLLTQARLLPVLPDHRGPVLRLDADWDEVAREDDRDPEVAVLPDHPAYAIYTSGSTGRPKGVVNTHRAIVNRLLWMQAEYGLSPDDRVLQKTPASFDVSVWEFFWPLIVGARLVMARPRGHQDSAYLVETIVRAEITTLHFVPSMLQVFLTQPGVERCVSLRRVMASGEALPPDLAERFYARVGDGPRLHNLYGPTEAAVDVTSWAVTPEATRATMPIGRPIANLRLHLLDAMLQPMPLGAAGHLHIGGVGLARGYFDRPDLTAERFVPDAFAEPSGGERLYATGDLARYQVDGTLEFLGRIDHQVKIRGLRLELGEIEAALAAQPGVREAVVVARDGSNGSLGERRLIAYVVPAGSDALDPSALADDLRATLPEYMVPAAFVSLPALPKTPSGKVDRRALPEPEAPPPSGAGPVAPRTELERFLAELWRTHVGDALDGRQVGVTDDFFALGGNSITGALLINRLQEALGEIVHVVAIFDAPTVERMGLYLRQHYPEAIARRWGEAREGAEAETALRPVPRPARVSEAEVAAFRALIRTLPPRAAAAPPAGSGGEPPESPSL
jgi:amino acid adenylation domain-containing protein